MVAAERAASRDERGRAGTDWIWIVQGLTALLFLASANTHGLQYERSRTGRAQWLSAVGRNGAIVLAVLESLGALGVILPMLTGTLVWLTPVAALCLVMLMVFAMVFHATRREWPNLILNAVFGVLAAIVAYGRWNLLGS